MNKGIAWARGDFLLFLNADDQLAHSRAVAEAMAAIAAAEGAAVHCFDYLPFSRTAPMPTVVARPRLDPRDPLSVHTVCHQSTIYPRALFAQVGVFDEAFRLAGDFEHRLRCRLAGVPFRVHGLALARFCVDGATTRQMSRSFAEATAAVRARCGRSAACRFRLLHLRARLRKWAATIAGTMLSPGMLSRLRAWSLRRRRG
jgi:GT2 family glycosyltransferase